LHNTADADLRLDLQRACARLTERQRAVLCMVLEGYTQREIGERLGMAQQTVADEWLRIMEELRTCST